MSGWNRRALAAILLGLATSACAGDDQAAGLPAGDAGRGATLFNQSVNGAPACSSCHTLDGTALVGPSLDGYGESAPTRQAGATAQDYTQASIWRPGDVVVDGFANEMYTGYAERLNAQEIADLVAFLLTQ